MVSCTIDIRLKPRASCDRISAGAGGIYQVSVTSPPIDNQANDHCIALFAKKLARPKSSISIIKGGHSRNKALLCEGISETELRSILEMKH